MSSIEKARIQARNVSTARRWHRRLALAFCAYLIAAALGALAHQAPRFMGSPPHKGAGLVEGKRFDPRQAVLSPAQAARALPQGLSQAAGVRLILVGGALAYQFDPGPGEAAHYVDAVHGRLLAGADETFAMEIAAGLHMHAVAGTASYLAKPGEGVPKDLGALPFWRLQVEGPWSPWAYVSTKEARVLRKDDRLRAFTGPIYRNLHMLDFVPGKRARDWALLIMAFSMLAIGVGGLWLAWETRRRKNTEK